MTRSIRHLLDRGWIMGVAAVILVVAAIGTTSVIASADEFQPLREPFPATETPFGLQSWPHGTCLDSREFGTFSITCDPSPNQRFRMHLVLQSDFFFQLVDEATGRCLDQLGSEVVTSECSDSSTTQAWTRDASYRDWDGRAVLHFLNQGTGQWLALGDFDVYATSDAGTFDRDFAIVW